MSEVEQLAAKVKELHLAKKEADSIAEEANSEYRKAAFELMNILQDHDKKKLEGSYGKISLVERKYFKCLDAAKAEQFFKDDGTYEQLRKITAADMSKRIAELAVDDGLVNPTLVPDCFEFAPSYSLRVT